MSYDLEDDFGGKFTINNQTGRVTLNGALDYEETSSYNLKIIATDSKNSTKEINNNFNVVDVTYLQNTLHVNQKIRSEPTSFLGQVGIAQYLMIDENLGLESDDEKRKIASFSASIPGTTYSLSGPGANFVEIDSNGILKFKQGVNFNLAENIPGASGGVLPVSVNATIPNEGIEKKHFNLIRKNVESNENLVMKVASTFSNKTHDNAINPFEASAERGDTNAVSKIKTESTLTVLDNKNSSHVNNALEKDYTSISSQTSYLTSSVSNGKIENDTETLDFEFAFPIDKSSGDSTFRQYAPMSSPNGKWDDERSVNNEIAKYACLDSGQGCGSATKEVSLSGNWNSSTETIDGNTKNIIESSDIKQSYRSGEGDEFIWMYLNKESSNITYNPPENNATGFSSGPNSRVGVSSGTLVSGNAVNETTFRNEIVIGGEVYTNNKLQSFLAGKKKVVAYAPVPIIHTNKFEKEEYSSYSDSRFKHVHTIMPNFVSEDYMQDKSDGTDNYFDFHQLQDDDYCKGKYSCMTYGTSGGSTFNSQDQTSALKTETQIDNMYAYTRNTLDPAVHISSERFGSHGNNLVPEGQSMWYQVYNPKGRGVGLFTQLNWSCGNLGKCSSDLPSHGISRGPHSSQQSFFSVLVSEVGDKSDFYMNGKYSSSETGQVLQGDHYWSYKRRSSRTTSLDGEFSSSSSSPQITFGVNPIACISGPDNGCFFGDNKPGTNNIGAPATAIVTTHDPCSESNYYLGCTDEPGTNMKLGVMYSMEKNTSDLESNLNYETETFYQGIVQQKQYDGSSYVDSIDLNGSGNTWRTSVSSSENSWSGSLSGFWITDLAGNVNSHPQFFASPLSIDFDSENDRVVARATDITIKSKEKVSVDNNGENDWYHSQGIYSTNNPDLKDLDSGSIHFNLEILEENKIARLARSLYK